MFDVVGAETFAYHTVCSTNIYRSNLTVSRCNRVTRQAIRTLSLQFLCKGFVQSSTSRGIPTTRSTPMDEKKPSFFCKKRSQTQWVLLGLFAVKPGFLNRPKFIVFLGFVSFKLFEWALVDTVHMK